MSQPSAPEGTSSAPEVVTLPVLGEFLNLTSLPPPGAKLLELQMCRDAAVDVVTASCGPLTPVTLTERVRIRAGRGLLATWPVLDVLSTHLPTSTGAIATGAPVLAVTSTPAGELLVPHGATGHLDVVYSAGRDPVPPALQLAVLVIAKHLYGTQRAGASRSQADTGSDVVAAGFAVPRRAVELMNAHRAPRVGSA